MDSKNSTPFILLLLLLLIEEDSLLHAAMIAAHQVITFRWRYLKKYRRLLGRPVKAADQARQPRARRVIPKRAKKDDTLNEFEINDIKKRTGVEVEQFEQILALVEPDLTKPRTGIRRNRTALSPARRLLLGLHWLRKYLDYHTLHLIYNVSESTICREINFLLPLLYSRLNFMDPLSQNGPQIVGCIGIIDCSPHMRDRVHPRSLDYYRGDKKYYFVSSQLITHLDGRPASVFVALGHNNDQALMKITETNLFMEENQVNLLADRGYTHHRIVNSYSTEWDSNCASARVMVENTIAVAKKYKALRCKFVQSPELQACAIIVGYELAASTIKSFPLRWTAFVHK